MSCLNGAPARGNRLDQAREVPETMGVTVCPAVFGYRAAFDHASTLGLTAQEFEPRGKAAAEIIHVYKYVSKSVYK